MIRTLRKRFTVVAMCSTFFVLAAIMAVFNFLNYVRFVDDADHTLQMIAENDGNFPLLPSQGNEPGKIEGEPKPEPEKVEGEEREPFKGGRKRVSPETPYRTRYFSVRLDETGNLISCDLQYIAAVSEERAVQYAREVVNDRKAKGFQDIYRYKSIQEDDATMVIFLDSREELDAFRTNLLTSLLVSGGGLLAVFVLVLIFSGMVFRPVARGYEKQKQFVTDASHEIKTPLTIIDANVEVIEMEHGEDVWTKSIRKQVRRLADLTGQLVTLTRFDEDVAWKQNSEFSFTNVVKESVQSFEVVARTCGKSVEMNVGEPIAMRGDEKAIRQLIGILMDNAVKYSTAESTIHVSLMKRGRKIHFEVFNETETIPKGSLDMLFERFYRLDHSRNSETGGSGIGLSVARAIVEAHHGKIRAQSDDGKSIRIVAEF